MAFTFASESQAWALMLRNLIISNGMIIIGISAAAISSLFAYTMGLNRLYAYGLLTLVLFLAGHFITIPFGYFLLAIGLVIIIGIGAAAISSLFAYTMGLKRLYTYGILILVLFLAGHFITIPFGYLLLIIGLVIIINGFVLLMQFIRKYPLLQGDAPNVEKAL